MEENSQYILSSLDNALSILNLFFDREELTAAEAAKLLHISRTAAFRLLVTLEAKGYVTKTDGGYRLGIKIFSLGQLAQSRMVLTKLIHPYLAAISERTGETAHLAVMDGPYNIVFIDKCLGNLYLKMDTVLGYRRWAHQTATGKVMLAWNSEDFIRDYAKNAVMEKLTPTSITTAEGLATELGKIREQGWACDNEESEIGLTCYAMPVFGPDGKPIAAISSSGPTTRMVMNRDRYLAALRNATIQINERT
jgi:IclR family KDG regulon transcriptional repressor